MTAVFPIGHYLGERNPGGHHTVRLGWEHRELSPDQFGVWVLTHGTTTNGRDEWTADQVIELAEGAGIRAASSTMATLLDTGVAAEAHDPEAFTGTHRLHPLMVGLGNTDATPDVFRLGFPGVTPVVEVSASAFELWQWTQLSPTLRHTREVREKATVERVPVRSPVSELLADLRELLVSNCAYLDLSAPGS